MKLLQNKSFLHLVKAEQQRYKKNRQNRGRIKIPEDLMRTLL